MSTIEQRRYSGSGRRFFYSGGVLVSEYVGESTPETDAWVEFEGVQRSTKKMDSRASLISVSTKSSSSLQQSLSPARSISTISSELIESQSSTPSSPQISIRIIDTEESSVLEPVSESLEEEPSAESEVSYTEQVLGEFICQYEQAETMSDWDRITAEFQAAVKDSSLDMDNHEVVERLVEARQSSYTQIKGQSPIYQRKLRRSKHGLEEGSEATESVSDARPEAKQSPAMQKKLSLLQQKKSKQLEDSTGSIPEKPELVSIEAGMKVEAELDRLESPRDSLLYAMGRVDAIAHSLGTYEAMQKWIKNFCCQ